MAAKDKKQSKTLKGKTVIFELHFYWRGKRRTPSVSKVFVGDNYEGLPSAIVESPEYEAFSKATDGLCKVLVKAGELD